jgi:hypothetical protein
LIRLVLLVVVPPAELDVLVLVVCAAALVNSIAAIAAIMNFFMAPAFINYSWNGSLSITIYLLPDQELFSAVRLPKTSADPTHAMHVLCVSDGLQDQCSRH